MWKANWEQMKQRFQKWWDRDGLLIGMWGAPETSYCLHEDVPAPATPAAIEERYCNAAFRAAENHFRLARSIFPLDVLPTATTDIGPGSVALFLGSRPGFAEDYWGVFRFNFFLFIGWALTVGAAFLTPAEPATNLFVAGSVFLAFAYLNPDFELVLFFILPVKVKWLALLTWVVYGFEFLGVVLSL